MNKTKIILDTDPGNDDLLAIIMALKSILWIAEKHCMKFEATNCLSRLPIPKLLLQLLH